MDKDFVIEGNSAEFYRQLMDRMNGKGDTGRMINFIIENTVLNERTVIADLAAGSGKYEELLKEKVKRIDAIELSDEMINIMNGLFKDDQKVKIIKGDIATTGLESNAYDVVLLIMTIHHIADAEPVLNEASRILKPNGRFIVIDRVARDVKKAVEFDKTDKQMKLMGHGPGHTYRTDAETSSLLELNFRILKKEEFPYEDERNPVMTRLLYAMEKKR